MNRRGLRFTATLAVGIFTAAISPSSVLASDYIKSHCKVKESGFSSTPTGGQEIDEADPGASARYKISIGAVIRNPKAQPGVNLTGYINLFGADGNKIKRVDNFETSTPFYVPAKGKSYLTANVETSEPVTRVRIIVRCQNFGKQPARPGMQISGRVVSREGGEMTASGTFKNRGKTRDFGQPTIIFRDIQGRIVGGSGCTFCPQVIGLLVKGDSHKWSVTVPNIPSAARFKGVVTYGPMLSHLPKP